MACNDGCFWTEPDLCSRCAGKATPAAAVGLATTSAPPAPPAEVLAELERENAEAMAVAALRISCPTCGARDGLACKALHEEQGFAGTHPARLELVAAVAVPHATLEFIAELEQMADAPRLTSLGLLAAMLVAELKERGVPASELFGEIERQADLLGLSGAHLGLHAGVAAAEMAAELAGAVAKEPTP
jgi:hypothetical protein